MIYFLIGLGGAAGSLLRYLMGNLLLGINPPVFPYGTLAANLAGSFLLGLLTEAWLKNGRVSTEMAAAAGTGMIGSFTTFSAFSAETVLMLKSGHFYLAFLYLILSLLGGLVFAWAGFQTGKRRGERG
ncbi:fluoride efflux transporter CrcB [Rossellomorea vietnamensis]|uniref:Fluoride-specific ion channel FluC n=1 Tax=Rossellomorea vietnamensis TaxID=218284 RepID=A0A5D4MI47_9BACI|nr:MULTISPECIES: fluoride efflux transporter CrcB [Bacillaceae]TYS01510.1 fluoride efflux transporter CrcB [Rossellomorea vietnamensis]